MRYVWLQLALGVAILVLVTSRGSHGQVLTVAQVQQAFAGQALPTQIVFGPDGCPKRTSARSRAEVVKLLNACAAVQLDGPHVKGLVADLRGSETAGSLITAYVLDSTAAADRYSAPEQPVGSLLPWRIQERNVVVLLQPRGRKYAPGIRAALAKLG
jgi:hypothetical protein